MRTRACILCTRRVVYGGWRKQQVAWRRGIMPDMGGALALMIGDDAARYHTRPSVARTNERGPVHSAPRGGPLPKQHTASPKQPKRRAPFPLPQLTNSYPPPYSPPTATFSTRHHKYVHYPFRLQPSPVLVRLKSRHLNSPASIPL